MTVLIAYLPAPEGEAALALGFSEATLRGTSAIVVNSPRRGVGDRVTTIRPDDAQAIVERGADAGVEVEVVQPAHEDDLADILNTVAAEHDCEIIVIGLRKRSAIGKFILGSQAQRILLDASVPVLTAKA